MAKHTCGSHSSGPSGCSRSVPIFWRATGLSLFHLRSNVVWQSNRRMFCRNVSGLILNGFLEPPKIKASGGNQLLLHRVITWCHGFWLIWFDYPNNPQRRTLPCFLVGENCTLRTKVCPPLQHLGRHRTGWASQVSPLLMLQGQTWRFWFLLCLEET